MQTKTEFLNVSHFDFIIALNKAQDTSPMVKSATTPACDIPVNDGSSYYLTKTGQSGFALSSTGELTSVYSTIKGMGDTILTEACKRGACHLDCFDGYLPKFYARHGFQEVRREANWTEGGPDVVFMERF